jgi:hypothetical protein
MIACAMNDPIEWANRTSGTPGNVAAISFDTARMSSSTAVQPFESAKWPGIPGTGFVPCPRASCPHTLNPALLRARAKRA